ncbi:hypothetical protein [Actinomadura chibensis]|uniref:hypothetical protein n=1 Tax=Actinomadura chibensis TaxID=392828 RepID=UPI0008307BA4|nr:hypothetical protein [Actinomadura chibensis]
MAVVALVSPGNAPGATTAAFALTLGWPRPALLAECDPSGGHILAGYFGGRVPYDRGLWQLALETRAGTRAALADLPNQTVPLDEDQQRLLLPGLRDPFHGVQVTDEMWNGIAEVLGRLPHLPVPLDVLVDIGEVDTDLPFPVVSAADIVVMVMRSSFTQAAKAKPRLAELRKALGETARIGLCLVGDGPYTTTELGKERNLGPFSLTVRLPEDARTAAVLSAGAPPRRGFATAPLMREATLAGRILLRHLEEPAAARVTVGGGVG